MLGELVVCEVVYRGRVYKQRRVVASPGEQRSNAWEWRA